MTRDSPTAVDPALVGELDDVLSTYSLKTSRTRYEDVLYLRDELRELFDRS